ncbi:hypothetical protein HMPREF1138_1997 [Actinomyces sp. ICM58]|uniref:hypothetical protein n=1 Tax=Actinomyces sp. ICM58 TaxID=1105030 RepID=UPI0002771386|nr:hypothetical protein HMPREF1138_1997 [Actinomyces sp. ICM58]
MSFTPVSPGARKRVKVIGALVGVLVVLVIAGVVALKVVNSSRTPEAEVRKYLDLLASGQASAATAMVDPGVSNDQRSFLTDDVMASATSLLVVEDVVADKNDSSDTRMVTATMQVNGERFTHSFVVTADKATMGVLDNWKIKDSLAVPVTVDGDGIGQFSVGGTKASIDKASFFMEGRSFLFYPGAYNFTPVVPNEYVDSTPVPVSVLDDARTAGGDGASDVTFKATYNDKLEAAALEAAQALVESCGTYPGNQGDDCSSLIQGDSVTAISIKEKPTSLDSYSFDPTSFSGSVTYTVTTEGTLFAGTRDVGLTVKVDARFDDDGMMMMTADGKPDFRVSFAF